jgi:hypothetical protein
MGIYVILSLIEVQGPYNEDRGGVLVRPNSTKDQGARVHLLDTKLLKEKSTCRKPGIGFILQ